MGCPNGQPICFLLKLSFTLYYNTLLRMRVRELKAGGVEAEAVTVAKVGVLLMAVDVVAHDRCVKSLRVSRMQA